MLLRNQLYAAIVDVPEYGVRGRRGDFDPLVSEDAFNSWRRESVERRMIVGLPFAKRLSIRRFK